METTQQNLFVQLIYANNKNEKNYSSVWLELIDKYERPQLDFSKTVFMSNCLQSGQTLYQENAQNCDFTRG
jgi:hypothetical protein